MNHDRSSRRTWLFALILTLLVHLVVVLGLVTLRPLSPTPVEAADPDPIQLVFTDPPAQTDATEPRTFSELPEDRADEPPDQADFLSNVDSRARDRAPGDEAGSLPRQDGSSDAPHVAMDPGNPAPPVQDPGEDSESAPAADAADAPGQPEGDSDPEPADRAGGHAVFQPVEPADGLDRPQEGTSASTPDLTRPRGDPLRGLRRPGGTSTPFETDHAEGTHDLFQEPMSNPEGNAGLEGDISLNTTAWEYAPWLQRFRREFMKNWYAPYAFYVGLIHGSTTVRVEIAQDGRMLVLDVLEEKGDASLHQASLAAFRVVAPFEALPPGFPEETLILTVKLTYPEHKRRR